jgi:hypothetical protein
VGESALDVLAREHEDLKKLFVQVQDPTVDRASVWLEIVNLMATHVAVERSFLFPLVKRHKLGGPALASQLRHDYGHMEHLLVLTERRKINSPDMPDLVTQLIDLFQSHLGLCENTLVPALSEALDEEHLDELGAKMRGAESVIISHPHPHLLALGPLYRLTTRMASAWDRTRDRTVRNR